MYLHTSMFKEGQVRTELTQQERLIYITLTPL